MLCLIVGSLQATHENEPRNWTIGSLAVCLSKMTFLSTASYISFVKVSGSDKPLKLALALSSITSAATNTSDNECLEILFSLLYTMLSVASTYCANIDTVFWDLATRISALTGSRNRNENPILVGVQKQSSNK